MKASKNKKVATQRATCVNAYLHMVGFGLVWFSEKEDINILEVAF